MGNSGAPLVGLEKAEISVADSVAGMIKVVRNNRIELGTDTRKTNMSTLSDRRGYEGEDFGQVYIVRRDGGGLVIAECPLSISDRLRWLWGYTVYHYPEVTDFYSIVMIDR